MVTPKPYLIEHGEDSANGCRGAAMGLIITALAVAGALVLVLIARKAGL